MFTSVSKKADESVTKKGGSAAKTGFVYLLVALLCAVIGAVYENFSHNVYSAYMVYAFIFPLAGGALPFCAAALYRARIPGRLALNLYHAGIATLTVGSFFHGVLEIYGTTNSLECVYWIVGAALFAAGVLIYLLELRRSRE